MSRPIRLFISYVGGKYFTAFIPRSTLATIWTSAIRFPVATQRLNFTVVLYILRNPTEPTELTEEPLPVHNKSNIKLYTTIGLSLMFITCKMSMANVKLIDNLIVSLDT